MTTSLGPPVTRPPDDPGDPADPDDAAAPPDQLHQARARGWTRCIRRASWADWLHRLDRLRRARRIGRPQPATARTALVIVVGVSAVCVVQLHRAQARLDALRDELEATAADLDAVRTDVREAHHRTELAQYSIEQTRTAIQTTEAQTTYMEALTSSTEQAIADVQADRREVDAARFLVAANANDATACFGGVSRAVGASRDGDDDASARALREHADHCTRALAVATGARFPYDFPDPFVLRVGDAYYGYSTNSGAGDIQVIRSTDLVEWDLVGNALANLPVWAAPDATWAPAVLERGGRYVVYYTARDRTSRQQCISRAVATDPAGPFRDGSTRPLVCQHDRGGSIDPSPFVGSDGRAFLLWKSEGSDRGPAAIWSQELTADGLALTGHAQQLIAADQDFERGVAEAPSLFEQGGHFYLLYAAADWGSQRYSTAYAICAGPEGPCLKPPDARVLTSGPRLAGPGGAEVVRDTHGATWVAFHAYAQPNVGYPSSRYLHVERLRVVNGRVVIDATT